MDQSYLEGVRVQDSLSGRYTRTDERGRFALTLDTTLALLQLTGVGLQPQRLRIAVRADTFLLIELSPFTVASVEISDSLPNLEVAKGGNLIAFPVSRLARIPALLGEPDLFKALTLLPGVSTGLEGTTGIQIRGGQPGQVLTLLDHVPVYSTSHLFGLVSAFQAEMLHSVSLYKGWAPGRYGGRITGALDIRTRPGDSTQAHQASVGLISSRVYVQGRLKGSRVRYTLGGRLAYLNLLTLPLGLAYRQGSTDQSFSYWLYDLHGSLLHQWKPGQTLRLSVYHSRDRWRTREGQFEVSESKGRYVWGNTVASLRYEHLVDAEQRFWLQAALSGYDYTLGLEETQATDLDSLISNGVTYENGLRDLQVKGAYQYRLSSAFEVEAGVQVGGLWLQPGAQEISAAASVAPLRSDTSFWLGNHALWLDTEATYGDLKLDLGLRVGAFQGEGANFLWVEPRATLAWEVARGYVLSGSYARQVQPLLWASPSQIGLPGDLWLPAGRRLEPQIADQFTLGVSKALSRGEVSLVAYYRHSQAEVLYQPSFMNIGGEFNYEQVLADINTGGEGRAYGVELSVALEGDRWSGWLGYTLASSEVKFAPRDWQPALFDQRHQVDLSAEWNLRPRVSLAANWVLRTGRPIFMPEGRIRTLNGRTTFLYGDEPVRLPAYHRLDLGLKWPARRKSADWQLGVYNLYNRLNPLFLNVVPPRRMGSGAPPNRVVRSIPGEVRAQSGIPFLPYLSYSWRF